MTKLIYYYDNKTACAVRLDEQIFLAFWQKVQNIWMRKWK